MTSPIDKIHEALDKLKFNALIRGHLDDAVVIKKTLSILSELEPKLSEAEAVDIIEKAIDG